MDHDFWHAKWKEGSLGFHLDSANPNLTEFANRLPAAGRVLVPLCGKTVDMAWLAAHGHRVVGVELSSIAARAFFEEAGLGEALQTEQAGPFTRYRAGDVEILQGDLFDLDAEVLGEVDAVYDRAALIALPEPLRSRYVQLLATLLADDTPYLLVTLEVEAREGGPPFSIDAQAVQQLFVGSYCIEALGRRPVPDGDPFAGAHEGRYLLTRSTK